MRQKIEEEIRQRGPIAFSRYMELCLYGPDGFYARAREQFGKAGDFYTSSDVHAVFGRLLARQFEQMWRMLGEPQQISLAELGPGRGLFAQDVLDWSQQKFPAFFNALRYVLVETSARLRERLQERFGEAAARGKVLITESIEAAGRTDSFIVFANEFFDALPVEVLDHRGELRVAVRDGRLAEEFVTPSLETIEFIDHYAVHPDEGERVEAALAALHQLRRIAEFARHGRGFLVFIDYGYTREEQVAGRHRGTLTAFRRHTMSDNPYEAPGEQDITAHVNFTALAAEARKHGLEPIALVTQSQFLMGIGEETRFSDAFEKAGLPEEHAKVALQLKHLIAPEGMGETFQVLVMACAVDKAEAARLSGLEFMRPGDRI